MDVMYERGVKMVCLAEALPSELFDPGPGRREDMPDEVFAFGRTASRLTEMQGQEYLRRRVLWSRRPPIDDGTPDTARFFCWFGVFPAC